MENLGYQTKPFLVMDNMETKHFSDMSFSFLVEPLNAFEVICHTKLEPYAVPLHSFSYEESMHVVPGYFYLV